MQRAANSGAKASIRGALDFISPQEKKPKKPKKVSEIETAAILGAFLDERHDLFFRALQLAPGLKADITRRLLSETTVEIPRDAAEAAGEARAILKLLGNASAPNIETAREKAGRIARLLGPVPAPRPASLAPCNAKLDLGALPKALALEPSDLDIPEFLQRTVH